MIQQASKRALFVVGPTASGKTSLAVEIALLSGGEVVSADSRQIYRFMDIGTAKPGPHEQKTVPHHMIDILPPDTVFSAGEYARLARAAIEEILARNRLPVVAGGSGLYIRALADGIFDGQYRNEALRSRLKSRLNDEGAPALHRRLAAADPDAAGRIHPNDGKRIIRALEVTALAGKPISSVQREETRAPDFEVRMVGLDWPRDVLYRRVEDRVDRMFESGLVAEVLGLAKKGFHSGLPGLDSVGYREVAAYLNGTLSQDEMIQRVKLNTRRYAKRQMTWFRRDNRIRWIPVSEPADWRELAGEVLRDFRSGSHAPSVPVPGSENP